MTMTRIMRMVFAIVAPLMLFGCVLTPGKFVSTMTINADRTFAFTYKGEVIAIDPSAALKGLGDKPGGDGDKPTTLGLSDAGNTSDAAPDGDNEAKNRAIAAALSKEAGYRSVVYQGKGKFLIDYAIAGTLTHGFVYPFNSDAEAVFPFIVIELRADNIVRVKAPGYSSNSSGSGAGTGIGSSMGDAGKALDGTFTLDTDAEIVSQNNEEGAKTTGKRRTITWRATPLTKDAPSAVLRLAR